VSDIVQTVRLKLLVDEPGVIQITYDYQIPAGVDSLAITFSDDRTKLQTHGFEINGSTCEWRKGNGQTPSIKMKFGVNDGRRSTHYVDTGEWAITRLPNIGWSWRWRGTGRKPSIVQRHEISGEGAISNDGAVAYLGPHQEYTDKATDTGERFRLVVPRDADLQEDPGEILFALTHASSFLDIGALNESVLAIVAPTLNQTWGVKGSQRGDAGFWVRDTAVTDETNETDELTECEFCGREFSEGSGDLEFHWYCDHPHEVVPGDEQFHAARIEYSDRLWDSVDVDVPVAIPQDTWEDVVASEFDDENPEDVAPGDISEDTLVDLVEPEYHFEIEARE